MVESFGAFEKCLALDADHFGASTHQAILLLQLGHLQTATTYFANSIRIKQQSVAPHFGLVLAIRNDAEMAQLTEDQKKRIQGLNK